MAMTLREIYDAFDKMINALPDLIVKNTEIGALDALALVDIRITQTGIDNKGSKFRDYTPAYKKSKEKKGRYRGFVDFQDTTEMLRSTTTGFENITPSYRSIVNGDAKIAFDGRDQLTNDKLIGNNKSRPGFLQPSEIEMKTVNKNANANLQEDLSNLFK